MNVNLRVLTTLQVQQQACNSLDTVLCWLHLVADFLGVVDADRVADGVADGVTDRVGINYGAVQSWLVLYHHFTKPLRPMFNNTLRVVPTLLFTGTFQGIPLAESQSSSFLMNGTDTQRLQLAALSRSRDGVDGMFKTISGSLQECKKFFHAVEVMFPEKVINNPGHRIPANVVDMAMECFDWESFLCDSRVAEPLTSQREFWKQKCAAFKGVVEYMQSRWPSVFSHLARGLGKKELSKQYITMTKTWYSLLQQRRSTFVKDDKLDWAAFWKAVHADEKFFVKDCAVAVGAFHVMGSFQTSEARCESLASKLKEYGASGVTASRAVLKSILWEANPESSEAFILRVWAEVMGGSLSFFNRRGQKRRKERFPLGLGSKTLHGLILARNKQKQTKTRFLDFKRIRKLRKVWMAAAKEIWTGRSKPRSAAAAGRASLRAWLDVGSKRMRTAY